MFNNLRSMIVNLGKVVKFQLNTTRAGTNSGYKTGSKLRWEWNGKSYSGRVVPCEKNASDTVYVRLDGTKGTNIALPKYLLVD